MALIGGSRRPFEGLIVIPAHAPTQEIENSEVVLRYIQTSLGGDRKLPVGGIVIPVEGCINIGL